MKKITLTLLLLLFLLTGQTQAQYNFTVTPSTCANCCDGRIILTQTFCQFGAASYTLTPYIAANSYSWNTLEFVNVCCGTYTIAMLSNWENCPKAIFTASILVPCLPTNLVSNSLTFLENPLYPNPTSGKIFTKLDHGKAILILDLFGKIVQTIETKDKEINLSDLNSGLYYIYLYSSDGKLIARQKLTIE